MPQKCPPLHFLYNAVLVCLLLAVATLLYESLVPKFNNNPRAARITAAQSDLSQLQQALDRFANDVGRYPTTAEGLHALIDNPHLTRWNGPYLPTTRRWSPLPSDPWGSPFRYTSSAPNNHPYTLTSDGPDATPHTRDDIDPP